MSQAEYDDPPLWMLRPFAPYPGAVLGPAAAIPDGAAKEYRFGFGPVAFRMFVVRTGEALRGYVNQCPHSNMPLNQQPDDFLTPDGDLLLCSQHLALFRIEDGACLYGPCEGRSLVPIGLIVRDGQIQIA